MFCSTDSYINSRLGILLRIAQVLTVLALIVTVTPRSASALTGNGTSSSPYMISTADDLDQFRDIVNGGDNDAWGVLTQDIDLSQLSDAIERENWTPIGNSSVQYTGTFDGADYTISNLKINSIEKYSGLFGYVYTNGNIKNIYISGYVIGTAYVGGVVGYNYGIVTNCTNTGNISGTSRGIAGIVGSNEDSGIVINCANFGKITGDHNGIGGVVGYNNGGTITNCSNTGEISNGSAFTGGIVGCAYGIVTHCSNLGSVNGSSSVGGIAGVSDYANSVIMNCINWGDVTGTSNMVGGIAGSNDCSVTNCINSGVISGNGSVGGIVGNNYENVNNCINVGSITGVSNAGSIAGTNKYIINEYTGSINQIGTVTNCGWLQGTCSIGIGINDDGAIVTNIVQFNSKQQPSIVAAAIPSIDKTKLDISKNETTSITFTTYPSQPNNRFNAASGFMRNIKANSENSSIVSVISVNQSDGTIIVGPKGAGTAKIIVTADLYATNFSSIGSYVTEPTSVEFAYYITVKEIPVQGITLSKSTLDLTVGDSFGLTASISPSNATNKAVTWSSSNSSIASVDSSGRVTAKGNGTATITVKSADNASISDTCTVNVTTSTSGVTVTPETAALNVGETKQLSAVVAPATASNKNVTWSTSSGNVATVNSSGLVTAVGNGTATITASTVSGGYSDTCAVTVSTPVTGVSLSSASLTINKGGTHQLTTTVSPETASNKTVSWSTSNPAVASVSQTGLITAIGGGSADITVTTVDGSYSAQCRVTVNVPVTGVQLDEVSASIGMDSSTTLGYTVLPSDASNKSVTWQSSNTSVAEIDSSTGLITPIAPGGTEITVTTVDGNYSDTLFLIVTSTLDTIRLNLVTESGYCPDFATVYNKASGYVVEYPGIYVSPSGEVEVPIPSGQDTCTVGISLLNTLIAGTSATPGADPESLYMIEGDFNADNVIDGTDYTILVQRMHFGGGLSEYGLTGDINYDSVVDKLDLMMFGSPVAYTGQSRFMQEGYDIESPEVQTNSLRSADKGFWVPVRSLLETKESGEGRYEISLQAPSEPVNMLQIALKGDISETSAAAPEGFELIGAYAEDGKSVVAIGSSEKGGSIVPADVPIVTVKATETPSVIYGEHDTVMQRADEYGIENIPLEMSVDAGGAVSYSGSGGSGCNFGLGALTLLIAAPLLFRNKHGR